MNAFGEAQALFERALALWERVPEPEQRRHDQLELLTRAAFATDRAATRRAPGGAAATRARAVGEDADPGARALLRAARPPLWCAAAAGGGRWRRWARALALLPGDDESEERATILASSARGADAPGPLATPPTGRRRSTSRAPTGTAARRRGAQRARHVRSPASGDPAEGSPAARVLAIAGARDAGGGCSPPGQHRGHAQRGRAARGGSGVAEGPAAWPRRWAAQPLAELRGRRARLHRRGLGDGRGAASRGRPAADGQHVPDESLRRIDSPSAAATTTARAACSTTSRRSWAARASRSSSASPPPARRAERRAGDLDAARAQSTRAWTGSSSARRTSRVFSLVAAAGSAWRPMPSQRARDLGDEEASGWPSAARRTCCSRRVRAPASPADRGRK